jgi:hypothetical protein
MLLDEGIGLIGIKGARREQIMAVKYALHPLIR